MLFRNQVRDVAADLLKAANTIAGANVFKTRIQPVAKYEPPLLLVFSPHEKGNSLGPNNIPRFRSVLTLVIQAMVSSTKDDACGDQLDELCEQAADALLTSSEFLNIPSSQGGRAIEEVKFLSTISSVTLNGDHFLGQAEIQIGLQYVDVYARRGGLPLSEVAVTVDAVNAYSPTGTFTDDAAAGFPHAHVKRSPRKSGPDGRAEPSFTIPFQPPKHE